MSWCICLDRCRDVGHRHQCCVLSPQCLQGCAIHQCRRWGRLPPYLPNPSKKRLLNYLKQISSEKYNTSNGYWMWFWCKSQVGRECVNFSNLNLVCSKERYLLRCIGELINLATGYLVMSFFYIVLGYIRYKCIPQAQRRRLLLPEKDYIYRVMPFEHKECMDELSEISGSSTQNKNRRTWRSMLKTC